MRAGTGITQSQSEATGGGGGGGTPGGANTEVQFNNLGSFGGSTGFIFNSTLKSVAIGTGSGVLGANALAVGANANANGTDSVAFGLNALASGNRSFIGGGNGNIASGPNSSVFGNASTASGNSSQARGNTCQSTADQAQSEGLFATASGQAAHAEGFETVASGLYSHSENAFNVASGNASSASGGLDSDSVGNLPNLVSGISARGQGLENNVSGFGAFASGRGLRAQADYSTIVGQWNTATGTPLTPADGDELFAVGFGTSDGARATAFSVQRNGQTNLYKNLNADTTIQPNNLGGENLHQWIVRFAPLQNSPNETWNIHNIDVELDVNSSGFTQGTAGGAAQIFNLGFTHHGTGNVGGLTYINFNSDLGNGTDPITVKSMGFILGFGNIHANVTIDGTFQGYTFQPNIDAAAIGTSNFSIAPFQDSANVGIPVNGYTSLNAGPNLFSVTNNHGYTGVNLNPTITTLTGNASYIGIGVAGTVTTMGASSNINGFSFAPLITTSHGSILGASINPTINGGDANFSGIVINPQGTAVLPNVTGLSINLSGLSNVDPINTIGISSDSRIQVNASVEVVSGQTFEIGNRIENLMHVTSGHPVTGTDSLSNNFAGDLEAEDNYALGPLGLGFISVGFIADMAVAVTKVVDAVTVFLPAVALPDPGFATNGTVTNMNIIKLLAPAAQGGTLQITNLYGIHLAQEFGVFASAATNVYGIYLDGGAITNWISGKTTFGGATFLAADTNAVLLLNDGHFQSAQTTVPTVTVSANAGGGATGSVTHATDTAGVLELITGTITLVAGAQITVNFNKTYTTAPIVTLTPKNTTAASAAVAAYITSTTSGFTVNFVTASIGSQTFDWFYHVIETQ